MTAAAGPGIADMLALLDRWRHLPAYRLESRADPFFALFLRDVVSRRLGKPLAPTFIPELPLRKATLWPSYAQEKSDSVKVDYALFSEDGRTVYLVELKTDQASRNVEQDEYLALSVGVGFKPIIDGILRIALDTKQTRKYLHLLRDLASLGYVDVPDAVYAHAYPEVRRGLTRELGAVRNLTDKDTQVVVLYVQPLDRDANTIDFAEFASAVEDRGALGAAFASALRRWVQPAGEADPRIEGR